MQHRSGPCIIIHEYMTVPGNRIYGNYQHAKHKGTWLCWQSLAIETLSQAVCHGSLTFCYPCPFPTTNQQFNSKVSCSFLYSPVPLHCSGQLSPQCQHTFRHWHVRPRGNTERTNLWLHRPSARALYLGMWTCQKWLVMLVAVILKRILGSYTKFKTINKGFKK